AAVEGAGGGVDLAGQEAADVDRGIPLAGGQGREVAGLAVAVPLVDGVAEEVGVGPAPVEGRDLVALGERGLHHRPADEPCPAEHQQPHPSPLSRRSVTLPDPATGGGVNYF